MRGEANAHGWGPLAPRLIVLCKTILPQFPVLRQDLSPYSL